MTAPRDESGHRTVFDAWMWITLRGGMGPAYLEEYETDQLREMAESLERAAAAVRRHIVRRGE